MDYDILDSLDDLGNSFSNIQIFDQRSMSLSEDSNYACLRYTGSLKSDDEIIEAIEKGVKSLAFTELVAWLSKELQALYNLESCVNALTDVEDSSSFLLEVSSFLKELRCPFQVLLNGPISQRLLDVQSRKTLIDYLCSELQAARLVHSKKKVKNALEIEMDSSSTAVSLQNAINVLNIEIDDSCDPCSILAEMEKQVNSFLQSRPECLSPPILTESLTEEQWENLSNLHKDLLAEYTVRREMLLTRLDVTVQSFKWGEATKGKEKKILSAYMPLRNKLKTTPSVQISDVVAARETLLILEKTSSAELVRNTKSSVNTILIPAVPDRGGRPKEQRPPVEMPNWMKRKPGGGGGGAGGGRGEHHGPSNWQGKGKKFRGNKGGDKGREKRHSGNFDAAGAY